MLECRPVNTPTNPNHKLSGGIGDQAEKEQYQHSVGKLIYLAHTGLDISHAVSVVSRYMHDPRVSHWKVVYQILRYLKVCPGKGMLFGKKRHMRIKVYTDADWARCLNDRKSTTMHCAFVRESRFLKK
jgi:hypothetical protein